MGGHWKVTVVNWDGSPSSHLFLSMDLCIEEDVLTLKDELGGPSQHLDLQARGQSPLQRDSLSYWLEGLLQAFQHLNYHIVRRDIDSFTIRLPGQGCGQGNTVRGKTEGETPIAEPRKDFRNGSQV